MCVCNTGQAAPYPTAQSAMPYPIVPPLPMGYNPYMNYQPPQPAPGGYPGYPGYPPTQQPGYAPQQPGYPAQYPGHPAYGQPGYPQPYPQGYPAYPRWSLLPLHVHWLAVVNGVHCKTWWLHWFFSCVNIANTDADVNCKMYCVMTYKISACFNICTESLAVVIAICIDLLFFKCVSRFRLDACRECWGPIYKRS